MSLSLILFKSKTCSQCIRVEAVFNSAVELFKDKIKSETIDITENVNAAVENGIMAVPSILIFKDGKEAKRLTGLVSKEKLEETIKGLS